MTRTPAYKLYFWQGMRPNPAGGRRIDTREVMLAPSKKRLLELTGTTHRPSDLFNLNVVENLEQAVLRDPSLQQVIDTPETIFWQRPANIDKTWTKV